MLVDVGHVADFPEGTITKLKVEGRDLGIVCWAGTLYAVRDRCPHAEGPLCDGVVRSQIVSDNPGRGEVDVDRSRPVIVCPWHYIEYDLQTGRGVRSINRIQTFPVSVAEERVQVRVGGDS